MNLSKTKQKLLKHFQILPKQNTTYRNSFKYLKNQQKPLKHFQKLPKQKETIKKSFKITPQKDNPYKDFQILIQLLSKSSNINKTQDR